MIVLYALRGDSFMREVEALLRKYDIQYESVDVKESGLLAHMDYTMGVTKLPALEVKCQHCNHTQSYQGIKEIREYIFQTYEGERENVQKS